VQHHEAESFGAVARTVDENRIYADEMYSTVCLEWAVDRFGLGDPLLTKTYAKNNFYNFVPGDLNF